MVDHPWVLFIFRKSADVWASDTLCRAVTGSGFTKRALYTDDNDFSYQFYRIFIINSISPCANRPDLLDRAIVVDLERILSDRRKPLRYLWKRVDRLKPRVFAAMLDGLAYALGTHKEITLTNPPTRLVDWCEYACAAADHVGVGHRTTSWNPFKTTLTDSTLKSHRATQ